MRDPAQLVLPYRCPENRPDPLKAMLLCLPALLCWTLFFGVITDLDWLPKSLNWPVLALWIAGICTSIYSFALYSRKLKPWYVFLALAINWSGIIFTVSPLGWLSAYALLTMD